MQLVFQITYNCNLRCSYCYQPKTANKVLKKEEAFAFIDDLFNYINGKESKIFSIYLNQASAPEQYRFNFYGGECLLYPELIMNIIDYWHDSCIKNNKENFWDNTALMFQSNGTLIKTDGVLAIENKYKDHIIWHITFEGTEEKQDAERKFADGRGSYKIIKENIEFLKQDLNDQECRRLPNKITFTPQTTSLLPSVAKALIKMGYHFVGLDYDTTVQINKEQADDYYKALCEVTDYVVENNLRFYPRHLGYTFNDEPRANKCGAWGASICLSPGGIISNCDKANASYIENNTEEVILGNVEDGITNLKQLDDLRYLEERCIEPKQCINCPIRHACDECPMENLKINGNIHKFWRNCGWHVAQARAQLYFYEKVKNTPSYTHYQKTIKHIEDTNMYDPNYHYWYIDNYKTEWVEKPKQALEKAIQDNDNEKEPE